MLGLVLAARLAPVKARPDAARPPRADRAARTRRGRRPRAAAAPRPLAAARPARAADPVHRELPAGLDRAGDLRRLPRRGLSLTYYARRRLGSRRWRNAHRLIPVAWALAAVHVIGAGTDVVSLGWRWCSRSRSPPWSSCSRSAGGSAERRVGAAARAAAAAGRGDASARRASPRRRAGVVSVSVRGERCERQRRLGRGEFERRARKSEGCAMFVAIIPTNIAHPRHRQPNPPPTRPQLTFASPTANDSSRVRARAGRE